MLTHRRYLKDTKKCYKLSEGDQLTILYDTVEMMLPTKFQKKKISFLVALYINLLALTTEIS